MKLGRQIRTTTKKFFHTIRSMKRRTTIGAKIIPSINDAATRIQKPAGWEGAFDGIRQIYQSHRRISRILDSLSTSCHIYIIYEPANRAIFAVQEGARLSA